MTECPNARKNLELAMIPKAVEPPYTSSAYRKAEIFGFLPTQKQKGLVTKEKTSKDEHIMGNRVPTQDREPLL